MYEAKYNRYLTKSHSRFAEPHEITAVTKAYRPDQPISGAPLYCEDNVLYMDPDDNHTVVVGPTGCKKTRVSTFATVASIIESGESAVINDPKQEIYYRTAQRAREKGAQVFLLNFRNPRQSHCWNPLSVPYNFHKAGRFDEANQAISDFAESVLSAYKKTTVDIYWAETSQAYLNSIAMALMDSVTENVFNIKTLVSTSYQSNEKYLARIMEHMDPSSPCALGLHAVIDLTAEKTKSCVYSTLVAALRPFAQNPALMDMLSGESFSIEALAEKQTLVYIVYPDEKNSLNFLVNAFLTQCYETLISVAHRYESDRLPLRVNFILDEFSNLTPIENFANRISESRSKNIRYFLYLQSYGQLVEKYGDCADTILSNCNNWICFGSKDLPFLRKLAEICGTEVDFNGIEHSLISPSQMQHLTKAWESAEVLVIKQGLYPYVTSLPDIDHTSLFRNYTPAKEPIHLEHPKAEFIDADLWVSGIVYVKSFKWPFAPTK